MKLLDINKQRYRKHLNILIVGSIATLLAGSLSLSALFISLVSSSDGDNFLLNLMAVLVTLAAMGTTLSLQKHKAFFYEIYYVWRLKMELNFINAKLRAVEAAAAKDNTQALTILCFYYKASRQLWTLDDNTISLDSLNIKEQRLNDRLNSLEITISSDDYDREQLKRF